MTTHTDDKAAKLEQIGRSAYECICELVRALQCDYERIEEIEERVGEIEEQLDDAPPEQMAERAETEMAESLREELEGLREELRELKAAAGECANDDDARERILEDALSLEVRSGWTTLGEELTADEYCILLSTGGPAVRIVGGLDRGEPTSATLEVQDWFTPWTEYAAADESILLAYAGCFYFGE